MEAPTRFSSGSLVLCLAAGFAAALHAQAPSAPIDRYPTVTDPTAKAALLRLADLTVVELRRPEAAQDSKLILDKVADGTLPLDGILPTVQRILEGATAAARPEHLPTLVALARHKNKAIRGTLASAQFYAVAHPQELLLELILTAESLLPGDLSDKKAAQERFDEFSSRVKTFCTYVPTTQREPVLEAVERFLERYDSSIRQFYGPKLHKMLSEQSLAEKHLPGVPPDASDNTPAKAPHDASKNRDAGGQGTSMSAHQGSWLAWAVLTFAAVAGLLLAVCRASE